MLANVLNTPVAELPMCNDINVAQYFLDTRSLNDCQLSCQYLAAGQ